MRINLETDALTTAGALQKVTWRLLPTEESWNTPQEEGEEEETRLDETTVTIEQSRGILVTVEYEKNTYTGILLRKVGEEDEDGFQHFPLLLTKMPGSLRETFLGFLSSTFDTRVSSLHLPRSGVMDAFEKYLEDVCVTEDGDEMEYSGRSRSLRGIIKEAEVFVGFDLPGGSAALKIIEIHLMREDLPRLLARGKQLRVQGSSLPFMEALTTYVKGHLALDLKHERVRIVRIACGAFVLGAEGKVKFSSPLGGDDLGSQQLRATRGLVDGLVQIAAGEMSGDVP